MLKDNGWFSWAIQDPGPENRIMSALVLPMSVVVHHSMEGGYNYPGGYIVLRDPEGFPTAWHWTVKRDGRVLQHYGTFRHLQHAHAANVLGPGGESEGYASQPLTPEQVAAWRHIHDDVNEYRERKGLPPFTRDTEPRPQTTKRGWVEHREMAPFYNTTQCPSERYAPLWATYEEDDMTPEQAAKLEACYAALCAGDQPLLDLWNQNGNSLLLGFSLEQALLAGHINNHSSGNLVIPDHTHEMPEQATQTGGVTP